MGLDIEQDESFQRREWRWQHGGTVLLVLVVVAALAGLLGAGPLSWTERESADGVVTVAFDRVTHHESDDSMTLAFGPEAVSDGTVTVELAGTWPGGVDLQGISPQPVEQRAVPGGLVLVFAADGADRVETNLRFRAQEYGPLRGEITVAGRSVSFSQFVLP
ncbi:hypothetical protein [Myceligenerans pegani]|uniref:Uncharacterized protein n=1 Tax=Myceligenerans pegani TaxID=2776917 RepID=A0ABR9MZ39_9MICO|nr:hypothetical protein [Myceligenerans sp. TRM 65318]MBE1876661.1 hypothetical protein [Myceligenerans sp. TRM 65318]MBE3018932.1 hypothetical protein [Myceligenerans sp. TRM 65318]